jgi:signal peptidase I
LIGPLVVLLIGVVVTLYVTNSTVRVDGPSMLPTLLDEDRLLVTRGYDAAVRGDIVVIDPPLHPLIKHDDTLIKRVVARGGDRIEIKDGLIFVNGLPEPTSYDVIQEDPRANLGVFTVPEGYVFVVGDNRPASLDSRSFGPVPLTDVRGKVVAVFAPLTRLGFVD